MTGRHDTDAPDGRTHILPAVAGKAARLFGIPAATLCGRLSDARPADPDAPLCGTCQERQDAMTARLDAQEPAPEVGARPTPAQWLARFDSLPTADRLARAADLMAAVDEATRCFQENHARRLMHEVAPVGGVTWRTEYRHSAFPNQPLSAPPYDPDEALADVLAIGDRRGGRAETRRVAETPWTPVTEPEAHL